MSFNIFYIFSILLLIFFYTNSKKISIYTKLYKKYDDDTPLTGGTGIYIFFILGIAYLYFLNEKFIINTSYIILTASLIFLVGLLDDIFNIRYLTRLLALFILIFIFLKFDNRFLINQLYFETLNKTFILNHSSYFITPLFILLLLNSINMADGINGNSGIIFLIYIFLLYEKNIQFNYFLFLISISLIIFLFFNFKNKIYMGDSGIYFLSFLISIYVINKYNISDTNLSSENIFLIFMIPGVDMFRLFCQRLYNKKNPFKGDLDHFHHLLIRKFNLKLSIIIYAVLILWPNIINKLIDVNDFVLISLNLFFFFIIIFFLKKLNKFSK